MNQCFPGDTKSQSLSALENLLNPQRRRRVQRKEPIMPIHLPARVLRDISKFAAKNHIHRIILFGSRARGTHTERSDIDIAVSGGDFDTFYRDIKNDVHSLLMFDVVNLDDGISEELQKELDRDGVVIYEKTR